MCYFYYFGMRTFYDSTGASIVVCSEIVTVGS